MATEHHSWADAWGDVDPKPTGTFTLGESVTGFFDSAMPFYQFAPEKMLRYFPTKRPFSMFYEWTGHIVPKDGKPGYLTYDIRPSGPVVAQRLWPHLWWRYIGKGKVLGLWRRGR